MTTHPPYFQRNRTLRAVLLRISGRVWASPNTFLGLLLGGMGRAQLQHYHGTIEILLESGPVFRTCRRIGISAFTLGDCVLYMVPPSRNLRVHEGRHSQQYWILGPFFLPVYFGLMAVYGYHKHPLEMDARACEFNVCGCLYGSGIGVSGSGNQTEGSISSGLD